MSNLNLELIEKVRKGEAAIEHTKKAEDIERLQYVLIKAFPNDNIHTKGNALYYYKYKDDKWSCDNTTHLEPIPLQSFFTNQLTPEDNKTIELIDERLRQLNIDENSSVMLEFLCRPDISQKIVKMLDGEKQPSPAKDEVMYYKCLEWSGEFCTVGKIYKTDINEPDYLVCNTGSLVLLSAGLFEPSTFEAYQAQQQSGLMGENSCIHKEEQQVEDVKERWSVEVYQPNITGDEGFKIHITPNFKLRKPLADEVAQKIKQLLTNI